MANDMLKKYVAEKRTGANLVGIQVDTQNAYLLDRGTGPMMLNALEEIAKKADIARIENEKQNLLLEAEETDLKFKKERLSDPLVYSDDEKYYGAMSDFNNLRKKKEALIAKSSFLTLEQKKQMIGRLKNNDELTLIGMMEKRNGVVIQKQVDDIIANTERKVAIAGQLSVNDVGGKEQAVQDITDMAENLKNLVGWNDSQASLYVSKNIMAMEKNIFGNEINKIINSGFSLSEKKNKINNLLSVVNNEEILNKMSEQYASQIKFNVTDEEFKESVNYFKAKIKDVYADVKATAHNQLEMIKSKEEAAYERAKNKELERINKINKAYNEGSFYKMLEAEEGTAIAYSDILAAESIADAENKPEKSFVYKHYGKSLEDFNSGNMYIKDFIPQETTDNLNGEISRRMKDLKQSRFEATYDVLSKFIIKENMTPTVAKTFINSFAATNGEYQQQEYTVIIDQIEAQMKNPKKKVETSEFRKVRKINDVISRSGEVSNTMLSVAMQTPEITILADEIVKKSGNTITPYVAYKTATQLYLGVNSITGTVPIADYEDDKQRAQFLKEVFSSKNFEIKRKLNETLGTDDEITSILSETKKDRKILFPAPMVGGMK